VAVHDVSTLCYLGLSVGRLPIHEEFKKHAFSNGIDLIALSIHQGFVFPDAAERKKNVDHTVKCMEMAYAMGIPCLRLNTGRWNTTKSFDGLMAAKGIEPNLPGYPGEDLRGRRRMVCARHRLRAHREVARGAGLYLMPNA